MVDLPLMDDPGLTERARSERAQLVDAARAVLRRSGFEGFKVQLILRQSGLSARTFYRHFSDKDEMVLTLIREEYAATARRLTRSMESAGEDPVKQVAAWIREMVSAASDPERGPRTRLFSGHHKLLSRYPGAAAECTAVILEPLAEAIRRGKESAVFATDDPAGDARQVARLAGGTVTEHLAGFIPDLGPETDAESVINFALRALSAPAPEPSTDR